MLCLLFSLAGLQGLAAAEPPVVVPTSRLLATAEPHQPSLPALETIPRLIRTLGDADYFAREKAATDLGKLGFEAVDALTAAADSDDPEVAARANHLLGVIRSNWALPGEPSAVARLLADYEMQDDANRESRVGQLADLPPNQGAGAVCRVICYERSLVLAKKAALRLLAALGDQEVNANLAATFEKVLGHSRRGPARWVLAWLRARHDPRALAELWTQIAEEEQTLLYRQPRESSLSIVESLLGAQIAALRKVGRSADATRCIERLIQLRRGDPADLARLLNWLIDEKDWPATRRVEEICRATIAQSSELLYLVAKAQTRRGDAAAAEQSARRALECDPGSGETALTAHLQAGEVLERTGHFAWAGKEWEHVIDRAGPQSTLAVIAARLLAEMQHDLGEDAAAAETLQVIEKAFAGRSDQWQLLDRDSDGREPVSLGALRARREFCDACRWKARGDHARQRQCLERALATGCYDIEVLIDSYQLPDSPPDCRARIRGLIAKRLCDLREEAADLGENVIAAQSCNEFAWLAANTEGNLDEALRLSQRSMELVGEQGSYCDTLARVYFARGDYKQAVMHQARAAELLPHVRAIQKQLDLFRAKAKASGIPLEKIPKLPKPSALPAQERFPGNAPSDDNNPFGRFQPSLPAHAQADASRC